MIEARIAGAEVVERDADAGLAQGAQGEFGRLHILHQGALGDLDLQPRRRKAGLAKDGQDPEPEAGIAQQHGRDVHREPHPRRPRHRRRAGAQQDLVGQLADQAAVLGDGDEAAGLDLAQGRVVPTGQGLEADDLARLQVHQRLEVGHDVLVLDGLQQFALQTVALADGLVHLRLEEPQRRAALGLGSVERDVGLAQHLRSVLGVLGDQRDADGRADLVASAVGGDRLFQVIGDAQRDRGGGVGPHQMRRQHRELVPAQPRDQVVLAHRRLQPVADPDQHLVADGMAVDVVDALEAVEVQQQQCVRAPGPGRRAQRGLQGVFELTAVGEAGEGILERQAAGLALGGHALGRLMARTYEIGGEDHHAAGHHRADDQQLSHLGGFGQIRLQRSGAEDVEVPDHEQGAGRHDQDIDDVLDIDATTHRHAWDLGERPATFHPDNLRGSRV